MRYGNVVGSRGSVVPLFLRQAEAGELTITDERMTRFWITLAQAVDFVLSRLLTMEGGEVFVPKIPSMRVVDIAEAIAPDATRRITGIRPGEKLHEVLLTEDEARHALELDDSYVIYPEFPLWRAEPYTGGTPVADGFRYSSDTNDEWLSRRASCARCCRRSSSPRRERVPAVRSPDDRRGGHRGRRWRRCASR